MDTSNKTGSGQAGANQQTSDNVHTTIARMAGDLRAMREAQAKTDAWMRRQDETTGRLLAEIGLARKAAEAASDAAVKAVTKIGQIESSWSLQQDRLTGRVAALEERISHQRSSASDDDPSIVPYDLDLLSENTQTRLVNADRAALFSAFIQEREATVKLREELAALQARVDERDVQATRLQTQARDDMSFRLAWWKLLVGAVVAVATGMAAAIGAMYHH